MNSKEVFLEQMIGFLPQNYIEYLNKNPEEDLISDSIKYEAAVLFSDISGFTTMSEALSRIGNEGAEEMSRILNNYFENIEEIVRNHEGYIQKTAGDSTTIFFIKDNNESYKDVLLKSIQCSVKIQELINSKFQYIETIAGIFKLAMKVGIDSGKVYTRCVGNEYNGYNFILLGKPIKGSSDAESNAKSGEIWVSNNSLSHIENSIDFIKNENYSRIISMKIPSKDYNYIKPFNTSELEKEEQINLTNKIKGFIPEEIYNRIILGQTSFLAEHRKITAIFVRFEGMEHIEGKIEKQIQEYIVKMNNIILRYGGRLQEYEGGDKGDKILIYFGAPKTFENDAERALRCASDIIEEGAKLPFIKQQHIGIATGNVYAGIVGYKLYKTYTTIGDIVNVAARLMQYAIEKKYTIILESITFERIDKLIDYEKLDEIIVKNRKQPIQIYNLKGVIKNVYKGYFERKQAEKMPLVGRKKELQTFRDIINNVKESKGQIVSILGEAGIGKSRLTDELISILFKENIKGYGGDCLSYGTSIPYFSWNEILKDFYQITNSDNEESKKLIEEFLYKVDNNFTSKLPIVCNILGIETEENELTKHLDAKLRKENFFSIVLESLKYKSKEEDGLFIIVEDAHWIDSISLELLNYVCRNISEEKILVLIVHRPLGDLPDRNFKEIFEYEHHMRFSLNYLEADETIELVNRKLNIEKISDDFKKLIVQRSQGNPFFIEEILNSLIDNGFIKYNKEKEKHEILKDLSKIDIPDTIQDIVLSRIDRLDESSKLTLKVASVVGRQFKYNVLKSIYPIELGKEKKELDDLLNNNLSKLRILDLMKLDIPEPDIEYIFKHVITQEVSYSSLLFSYRRTLHEKIAQYYEKINPDRIDIIAHHYENTDNTKKKIEYFEKAAKQAENNYANQEAIEYYQKLISLIEDEIQKTKIHLLDKYHKNISELWDKQKYDEIEELIKKSEDLIPEIKDSRLISNYKSDLAKIYYNQFEYDKALEEFLYSLELNKNNNSKERIAVDLFNIGVIYFKKNDKQKSKSYLNDALKIAKDINYEILINSAEEALKEL